MQENDNQSVFDTERVPPDDLFLEIAPKSDNTVFKIVEAGKIYLDQTGAFQFRSSRGY